MTRRDLLKLLLASAVAEAVDVEQLLWVPKPIITVPAFGFQAVTFKGIPLVFDELVPESSVILTMKVNPMRFVPR